MSDSANDLRLQQKNLVQSFMEQRMEPMIRPRRTNGELTRALKSGGNTGLLCMLWLVTAAVNANESTTACPPEAKSQSDVVNVMRQMYEAAKIDDLSGFKGVVTPDYYAFDGGVRYTAESLFGLVKQAHEKGTKFEWNVTEPEVHVTCDNAWLTYVNRGSIETSAGKVPIVWLESAQLVYRNGEWRIHFFHSTRAPKVP